ncbi:MAG: hypothetical protein R3F35_15530 [Myxococcota bacterium]
MAYLVRRRGERVEIRESCTTERGPRSRTLARFTGALTPAVLATAETRATRPFDPRALVRRARALGIPVRLQSPEREARALLARLRRGDPVDPVVAGLLFRVLEGVERRPVPEALAEVADWVGAPLAARGAALRDLLETYGRIEAARPPRRTRARRSFPRFSSVAKAAAS